MSKPRHADKDSAPTSSGSKQIHHLSNYIFLFLLAVFLIAVYTFLLQKSYSTSTLEANVDQNITCSDAIHKLVSNTFTRDDFTDINTVDDMSSERYQTLQTTLNQIRSLNSTRYLYTAKSNSEGKLIYLVDGLDLDTSDFAYPGTYIKDEMIPYINSTLSGKTIYSQETIDTTWGHIFTACYPVKATDGSNEIIGALCIEMDMESAYTFLSKSSRNSLQIAIAAAIIALLLRGTILNNKYRARRHLAAESAATSVLLISCRGTCANAKGNIHKRQNDGISNLCCFSDYRFRRQHRIHSLHEGFNHSRKIIISHYATSLFNSLMSFCKSLSK